MYLLDPSNDLQSVTLNDTVTDTTDWPNDLLIDAQADAPDMTAAVSGRMDCQLEFVSRIPANEELMANDLGNFVTEGSSTSDGNVSAPLTTLHQANYELMNEQKLSNEAKKLFCAKRNDYF